MINFTQAQLTAWLTAFMWPLTRILALIMVAPVLSNNAISTMTKIGLGMAITIIVSPILDPMPPVELGSWPGLLIMAQQIVIGVAMGFAMRIVFTAVEMAGNISAMQMGLGFASFYDPAAGGQTAVVSQFLGYFASLVFLSINGHLLMISALADSFHTFPVGAAFTALGWKTLVYYGGKIFFSGLLLALPMLATLLITNIALGILTRAAPQLNIFAVGFPVTLSIGIIVLIIATPYFVPLFESLMQNGIDMMLQLPKLSRQ